MALVAMLILAVLIWLLTSRSPLWQSYAVIYTYVIDCAGLPNGAPVRLNGITVGSVDQVEFFRSSDPNRTVRITLKIEQAHLRNIPIDSIADITSENVLSGKYVSISRGRSSQTVKPGGEIRGQPSPEIADLVKKGFDIFDSAQAILGRVDRIIGLVESGQGSLGKFLVDEEFYRRLVQTVTEVQKVAEAISSGKGTLGRLLYDESLYNEARAAVAGLDQVIADLQAGQGTAGKLLKDPALYNELQASATQVRQLLNDLNAGRGTAGKLLKDEAAYQQIQSVLGKMDTTLDRLNAGQGTLGQLMTNPELYESMHGLTTELNALVKDIRGNPKKFLRIKLAIF
jgi:phospholipid/cholesterol/gamma-HCH transport system substrate-binding protein